MPMGGGVGGPVGLPGVGVPGATFGNAQAPRAGNQIQTFGSNTGTGSNRPGSNPNPTAPAVQQAQQRASTPRSGKGSGPLSQIRESLQKYEDHSIAIQADTKEFHKQMSDLFKSIDTSAKTSNDSLNKMMQGLEKGAKSTAKSWNGVRDTLGGIVDEMDDFGSKVKALSSITRKISFGDMFDGRTVKEAKKDIKAILETLEDIEETAKKDPTKFGKQAEEARKFKEELLKVQEELSNVTDEGEAVGDSIKESFNKASQSMHKSIKELRKAHSEWYEEAKKDGFEYLRDLTTQNNKLFDSLKKNKTLLTGLGKAAGFAGSKAKEISDRVIANRAAKQQSLEQAWAADPRGMGAQMFGGTRGFNPIRNMMFSRAMKANSLSDMGIMGRMAMEGGGSLMKGLGGRALGGGAQAISAIGGLAGGGGLGSLMKFAGPVGVGLSVVKGLADIMDKVAEKNRAIESATAQGGLMAGRAGRGGQGFKGVRNFVDSGDKDMYMYGQDSQKNLDVLKAMTESGLGLDADIRNNTAKGLGQSMTDFKSGIDNSSRSSVFFNSMYGSRTLGMSQEESAKLTTQLMMKFQQSAKDTVTFFEQVSEQSATAGISTSKYIDVIQGLADKMGDLNSSFVQVVTTVEKLGKSGRFTADQLKQMGETMLEGGKKAGVEYTAYMFQRNGMASMRKAADMDEQIAAAGIQNDKRFKQYLGDKFDITNYKGKPDELEALLDAKGRSGAIQGTDLKNMQAMVSAYKKAYNDRQALGGNEVSSALALNAMGGGANTNVTWTLESLKRIAADTGVKGGVGALLENPGEAIRSGNGMTAMYLEQLTKSNPRALEDVSRFMGGIASSSVATAGLNTEEGATVRKKILGGMSSSAKAQFGLTGPDAEDKLKKLATNTEAGGDEARAALGATLKKNVGLMEDILNTSDAAKAYLSEANSLAAKQAEEDKARAADSQTKLTADIFARAFSGLFDKIFNPIASLRDWFVKGKDVQEADQVSKQIDWMTGGKLMDRIAQAKERKKTMTGDAAKAQQDLIDKMENLDPGSFKTQDEYAAAHNILTKAAGGTNFINGRGESVSEKDAIFDVKKAKDSRGIRNKVQDFKGAWGPNTVWDFARGGFGEGVTAEELSKLSDPGDRSATLAALLYGGTTGSTVARDEKTGNYYQEIKANMAQSLQALIARMGGSKNAGFSVSKNAQGQNVVIYNSYGAEFNAKFNNAGVPVVDAGEGKTFKQKAE